MNIAEMVSKEINTPKGQEKMKKWLEEYTRKENIKNKKIEEMLSNTDYLKWLENFTITHSSFTDDDWLYFPEKLKEDDRNQVERLHLMYSGIEKYASENYIYPIACDFGNFYKIRLGNTGFDIGRLDGQGTLFFCNRVEVENEKNFIDFNNIMNNKKGDNVCVIKNNLKELSNIIVSLYESGVPIQAIVKTLDNTLDDINFKNDLGGVKTLKRK